MKRAVLTSAVVLLVMGCGNSDSSSPPKSFTDITYDYAWPADLTGYKIRMTDTDFVREDRLFQEFLPDGYDHAFVLDFLTSTDFEIYGYETDNLKYASTGYTVEAFVDEDGNASIGVTMHYTYRDVSGLDLEGSDECRYYPTSATGGTYMCWGTYPGSTPLYDAKTGTYELVVDPTAP